MKRLVFLVGILIILSGCAMQEDVLILNDKLNSMNKRTEEIYKEISGLQGQLGKTRDELKNIDVVQSVQVMSKKQAEMGIRLEGVKEELMRLRGSLERQENRLQELTLQGEAEGSGVKEKLEGLSAQYDSLLAKVTGLEKAISDAAELRAKVTDLEKSVADMNVLQAKVTDLEKAVAKVETRAPAETKPPIAAEKKKLKVEAAKGHYQEAYQLYKDNAYRQAIEKFRTFLKEYPDSKLAGNARFWLGECYYQQERYEEAILEYEKVIREHKGPKAPAALLKEGLAFQRLGETATAKLLMEKLIAEYPKSEQAEAARSKLRQWGKD